MKTTGAKALFAAAALLAFADGGFACENCPDDEPAAASGDGRRRVLMAVNKSPGEAVALDVSALCPGGTDFLPATIPERTFCRPRSFPAIRRTPTTTSAPRTVSSRGRSGLRWRMGRQPCRPIPSRRLCLRTILEVSSRPGSLLETCESAH